MAGPPHPYYTARGAAVPVSGEKVDPGPHAEERKHACHREEDARPALQKLEGAAGGVRNGISRQTASMVGGGRTAPRADDAPHDEDDGEAEEAESEERVSRTFS